MNQLGRLSLLLLPALAWAHLCLAQDTTKHLLPKVARTDTPFLPSVRALARANQLVDLQSGPTRGTVAELRLWHGFGLWGVALYTLRLERTGWHEYQIYPTEGDSLGRLTRTDTLPTPADRWAAAIAAGLLSLPRFPQREPSGLLVSDGYSVVLE